MAAKKKESNCIGIVADLHIDNHPKYGGPIIAGLNRRAKETLDAFSASISKAKAAGVKVLFVAGDLFNKCRPEPSLIAAVKHVLSSEDAQTMGVVLIPGNHDMPDATAKDGNTALAPLFNEATIVTEPTWIDMEELGITALCVPFQSQMPMSEYLRTFEPPPCELINTRKILITHVGVYGDDKGAGEWKARANDAIHYDALFDVMTRLGVLDCFVGNFHHREFWECEGVTGAMSILQVGTLIPHGFGDDGTYPAVGGLSLYVPDSITGVEVPGPRFFRVDEANDAAMAMPMLVAKSHPVYARLGPKAGEKVRAVLATGAIVVEDAAPVDATIDLGPLPQVSDAKAAIAEFIEQMTLPPGVSRDDVHAEALGVWNALSAGRDQ
jgi:hypothetical protein